MSNCSATWAKKYASAGTLAALVVVVQSSLCKTSGTIKTSLSLLLLIELMRSANCMKANQIKSNFCDSISAKCAEDRSSHKTSYLIKYVWDHLHRRSRWSYRNLASEACTLCFFLWNPAQWFPEYDFFWKLDTFWGAWTLNQEAHFWVSFNIHMLAMAYWHTRLNETGLALCQPWTGFNLPSYVPSLSTSWSTTMMPSKVCVVTS